ncbi:hypothetical protein MHH28_13605 [Paenibacillus sp. FSL K6-1217]|uniref:hypothetical protein n=1 Tax=Paenibacillus sp. FSL K6-1217 TaxID=2921466 RepID=UPI003247F92C
MRRSFLVLLFLIFLTACSSKGGGLTTDDLAIEKVNDEKQIVSYGMSRSTAEKVLGEGEKDSEANSYNYKNGVRVLYRDNSVVFIYLGEASKGVYRTVQGAEINMNTDELKKIYGEDNYIGENGMVFAYAYDSINKRYLSEMVAGSEEREKIYEISFGYNGGELEGILLSDHKATFDRK